MLIKKQAIYRWRGKGLLYRKTFGEVSSDVSIATRDKRTLAHPWGKGKNIFSKDFTMSQSSCDRLDVFKSGLVQGARFSAVYEFPILKPVQFKPEQAIPFEKAYRAANQHQWVHFYTHDRNFECVWNRPERYLPMFRRFAGVISPDFSLYREMPLAMQIWNTYRNRAIAFCLQREGIPVIPNVRWGDERTYEFAFEGLPQGGTVAVSTNGTLRKKPDREYFKQGLARMVEQLQPETIVSYSQTPEDIFGEYKQRGLEIIEIPYYHAAHKKGVA